MPLPTPTKKEDKEKFVQRCIKTLAKEGDRWPDNEQRIAVCFTQWRKTNENKTLKKIDNIIETITTADVAQNDTGKNCPEGYRWCEKSKKCKKSKEEKI